MTTSKTILVIIVGAFVLARVFILGYAISKRSEKIINVTHNAYTHFIGTCVVGWALYELCQD